MDGLRCGWLAMLAGLAGCGTCAAAGRVPEMPRSLSFSALTILQKVPEDYRARVQTVVDKPVLCTRGPAEVFQCNPEVYHWLLDHPDRAFKAWIRLGARCMKITDRGNGRFGCKDGMGSDVYWDTVVSGTGQRVWYAEGVVKPSLLLPTLPVRAIIVMHITEARDSSGRTAIRHQAEVVLHTDSKAASLATRILGASAPRLAEQYAGQIQTFFGALAWHLNEHPQRMNGLLAE